MQALRILVCDDEESIRDVFQAVLEEEGHAVTSVATGEAALEQAASGDFDLAFLDIKLPGISGVEVLRELRKRGEKPRIIMITGVLDDDLYDLSIYSRDAANGFLTKPCSFESIRDCITKVMDESRTVVRTPRDELRYAASKVREALQQARQTFALAELGEASPLTARLATHFGFQGPYLGALALGSPAGLRAVLRDDPEFSEGQGLYSELTARLVAEMVRKLLRADWGVALVHPPGPLPVTSDLPDGAAFLAISGPGTDLVQTKRFAEADAQATTDACHATLVELHSALKKASA